MGQFGIPAVPDQLDLRKNEMHLWVETRVAVFADSGYRAQGKYFMKGKKQQAVLFAKSDLLGKSVD